MSRMNRWIFSEGSLACSPRRVRIYRKSSLTIRGCFDILAGCLWACKWFNFRYFINLYDYIVLKSFGSKTR